MKYAVEKLIDGKRTLPEIVELLCSKLEKEGLSFLVRRLYFLRLCSAKTTGSYMLVLTDTGDLEPELDISKKAVQSVGLRDKRFVQENLFAGSFLPGLYAIMNFG